MVEKVIEDLVSQDAFKLCTWAGMTTEEITDPGAGSKQVTDKQIKPQWVGRRA